MSVDCHIYLPADVRVRDVAEVVGILAGLPKTKKELGKPSEGWYVQVAGVEAKGSTVPSLATIELCGDMVDGLTNHFGYFHFEPSDSTMRLLSVKSTAFWIAVGRGLVDFFGGYVDYDDCDTKYKDYIRPKSQRNNPSDGAAWQKFQERMWSVKPLTKKDLANAQKWANYK